MEQEGISVETADFMQKLSQHAQQTGELMEEAVRQMEMLQADCADRNRWKQIAEAQNKRIDELEATAKGFQELCESINQTNTAMGKKLLQMQAQLEQAKAERDAAIKDIPHKCWSCRNGFYTENGFDCNETHYKSGHKDCLSWQWRGAKEG